MSQTFNIVVHLTPAKVVTVEAIIATSKLTSDTLNISMSESQIKGLIKIGPKRGAEILAIYTKILKTFPSTIPADFTLADFEALLQERIDSLSMAALYEAEASKYAIHAETTGNNLLLMGIEALDLAKVQMKGNSSMTTKVNEITTEFFSPSAATGMTTYSIAALATIEVTNLVTSKMLVNDGNTILKMLVQGGNAANTITIYPGDGVMVPKGWTNVTMTNVSATTIGSFSVKIK